MRQILSSITHQNVSNYLTTDSEIEMSEQSPNKKYVLNVESISNWKTDKAANFSTLGLSDRRRKFFSSLEEGDIVITYVKATGFVDVREISAAGITKLGIKGTYPDGAWPWQIGTRPVACLGIDNAVSPNDFPHTKLCAGQWRYRFQQSGIRMDPEDGRQIAAAIVKAANKIAKAV